MLYIYIYILLRQKKKAKAMDVFWAIHVLLINVITVPNLVLYLSSFDLHLSSAE